MNRIIKLLKIGRGQGINLPKAMVELLGINLGDELEVTLDTKKKCLIIKKK